MLIFRVKLNKQVITQLIQSSFRKLLLYIVFWNFCWVRLVYFRQIFRLSFLCPGQTDVSICEMAYLLNAIILEGIARLSWRITQEISLRTRPKLQAYFTLLCHSQAVISPGFGNFAFNDFKILLRGVALCPGAIFCKALDTAVVVFR